MKKAIVLLFTIFLATSACVGPDMQPDNNQRIARATKSEGEAFLAEGNYTAALSKLLEAGKSLPNDPYLHNSLGLAYMGKKRDDLAETAFKKALQLKPDYSEALNNLGAAFLRQEKWQPAIEAFQTVLDDLLYPTPHFPLSNLGWAFLGQNNFQQAETYFKKALEAFPWYVVASHGLTRVYLETNRPDKAVRFLNTCLAKIPDAAILHADLAETYEILDRPDQARRSWHRVLRFATANSGLARKAEKKLSGSN